MPQHPFCSGHGHLADGTIVAAGGEMPANQYPETPTGVDWLLEGRQTVRLFNRTTLEWSISPTQLQASPATCSAQAGRGGGAGRMYRMTPPPPVIGHVHEHEHHGTHAMRACCLPARPPAVRSVTGAP